jgi:hypothetical protein
VDLALDLVVGGLFGRAEQPVPGIADRYVNPAQRKDGLVRHLPDLVRVSDIQPRGPWRLP